MTSGQIVKVHGDQDGIGRSIPILTGGMAP